VTRRDHLIRLGLAQRKSPAVADEERPDEPAKPDAAPADKPA